MEISCKGIIINFILQINCCSILIFCEFEKTAAQTSAEWVTNKNSKAENVRQIDKNGPAPRRNEWHHFYSNVDGISSEHESSASVDDEREFLDAEQHFRQGLDSLDAERSRGKSKFISFSILIRVEKNRFSVAKKIVFFERKNRFSKIQKPKTDFLKICLYLVNSLPYK